MSGRYGHPGYCSCVALPSAIHGGRMALRGVRTSLCITGRAERLFYRVQIPHLNADLAFSSRAPIGVPASWLSPQISWTISFSLAFPRSFLQTGRTCA